MRTATPSVGPLLKQWREQRHLSQLALATRAEVSARHLCFVETGRASPSREMVLHLASVLDVPLRERNDLLLAAGFAPVFSEAKLDDPTLAVVRKALDAILAQQEPYPAVVMNRSWDVLRVNDAAARFFGLFLGKKKAGAPANVLRMMFDPEGMRPFVENWEAVAASLALRTQREALAGVIDAKTAAVLAAIRAYPGAKAAFAPPHTTGLVPIVPVCFRKGRLAFDFFSAVTTLGTPQDITVQEIRIESFFPANEATADAARRLATSRGRDRRTRGRP